jgi:uncharacterized protein YecE (DUF72 family)
MNKVHIGTSGWAYDAWKPGFYPPKTPSTKFLDYYSTQLNCVEVNYTFRARPALKTLQHWSEVTPEDFRFAVKAHQRITHIKRLKDVEQDVDSFYASLRPLFHTHKLGPVLFQLPPNLKVDVDLLRGFLLRLPKDARAVIEYRNESWFNDGVYNLMREHDVALCVAESDELQVPEVHTATFAYYRLRKSDYSESELREVESRLANSAKEREVYAFLKHEETPEGALNARRLLQALSQSQDDTRVA